MDDVGGAGNPDGAVGFQDALRGGEPGAVELVIGIGAAGFVPITFVDRNHFAGVAGDAAVGEEVGRVGEYEVDGIFRDGGEDFEAVALVEAEVVFGVVEGKTAVVSFQLSVVSKAQDRSGRGVGDGVGAAVRRPALRRAGRTGDRFGHSFSDRARRTGRNPCATGIRIVDQVGIVDQGVKASQGGRGRISHRGAEGTEGGRKIGRRRRQNG